MSPSPPPSPPPTTTLSLLPATRPDLPTLAQIQLEAFSSSSFQTTLFPLGATPATLARMTERFERAFDGDEFSRFVTVREILSSSSSSSSFSSESRDDGGGMDSGEVGGEGKIVGFARWHCFERERSEDEWMKEEKREWPPEVNLGAVQEFFGELEAKRRGIMGGKRHYLSVAKGKADDVRTVLGVLVVHPAYQRRGAGAKLLEWGLERADTLGIPSYLEASKAGYGLYQKHGYEEVDEVVTDMGKWGGEGVYRHICMIRQPVRREVGRS
ncbi:MAG: hypothetical protein M1836_007233 [Candelina mexicana]|nr:MAG: hypothetical protein M1836_007233 [Candelina mexicana]